MKLGLQSVFQNCIHIKYNAIVINHFFQQQRRVVRRLKTYFHNIFRDKVTVTVETVFEAVYYNKLVQFKSFDLIL